jgi:hypothetical protein
MPDIEKPFSIYYDALGEGLVCVLMQDGHVVAYASRHLRMHEEDYLTLNMELAVMVHAPKIWRYYLMEKRCELYLDNKSLNYNFMKADLSLRPRRWLELIKDYDLGINCHPRKAIAIVDTWSQNIL